MERLEFDLLFRWFVEVLTLHYQVLALLGLGPERSVAEEASPPSCKSRRQALQPRKV